MGEVNFDRRSVWTPRPRPEWMAKFNALGQGLDAQAVIPLEPEALIRQAIDNTGLSDFGEGDWHRHFTVLMAAIEAEAKLHFAGRLLTRAEMLMYLEARLQMVEAYKRHPEIDEEQVDRPVFITGFARSGTTILFEILAQDPQFRVVTKWESLFPCPPPETATRLTDPRIARGNAFAELLDEMTPEFKTAHRSGATLPVESLETEYSNFLSDVYPIAFQIPSYARYLATQDLTETIAWQKKTLKLLQWRDKARHWLMKSPSHLPHVGTILKVFPDMRVIFTHRDPVVTADSVVSVMGMLYWLRTDEPWGEGGTESWSLSNAESRAGAFDDAIALIENGTLPKGQYANFHYATFMADPMASIRAIYADLDMDLDDAVADRMEAFLQSKTKGKFGRHDYEQTSEGIVDRERAAYTRYESYFGVEREI